MNEFVFKHTLPIQLRFNDVDTFGHVNNTVYFSFYDLGKTTYFDGLKQQNPALENIDIVIVNLQADFLSPIFPVEQVAVQTAVIELGNKSFRMLQQVINTETDEIKCICKTVLVGFDKNTNTAKPIPIEWKKAICAYENQKVLLK